MEGIATSTDLKLDTRFGKRQQAFKWRYANTWSSDNVFTLHIYPCWVQYKCNSLLSAQTGVFFFAISRFVICHSNKFVVLRTGACAGDWDCLQMHWSSLMHANSFPDLTFTSSLPHVKSPDFTPTTIFFSVQERRCLVCFSGMRLHINKSFVDLNSKWSFGCRWRNAICSGSISSLLAVNCQYVLVTCRLLSSTSTLCA